MHFANPHIFWLFLVFIPLILWYVLKYRKLHPSIGMSSTRPFDSLGQSKMAMLRHLVFIMQLAAIGCLIVVLARPQTVSKWRTSQTNGTEIVLAIDVSSSMLARDFDPDRLSAAKEVASRFISDRENDNLGLVIFAGESFTAVPMTTDRSLLINYLNSIEVGLLEDGTAIGDGIATAINRIKDGKAKSKSIILLTDGSNNRGNVAPLTAAEIAKKLGIKVYTIGVGTEGMADYPSSIDPLGRIIYTRMPVTIDEETLKQIAQTTGGKYFRATDNNVLQKIFDEINSLEKTEIDVRKFSNTEDDYLLWGIMALVLVCGAFVLRHTLLRSIP